MFPVLAAPFHVDLSPDEAGLASIRHAIDAGAYGLAYSSVASTFAAMVADARAARAGSSAYLSGVTTPARLPDVPTR